MITDPGERSSILVGTVGILLTTYIGLRMSEDVGITTTCKRVEDTTMTQVDMGTTGNLSFEASTIDKLTLCHLWTVASSASRHTGEACLAVQVDIGAISLIIIVMQDMRRRVLGILFMIVSLTDGTLLTTTENLEAVAPIQVDGGTTPYLCIATITATKDV